MVVVEEQDYYSDSDDEDVDRYVFLARQPAPSSRRHPVPEDDRDATSTNDDDDGDGTAGGEGSESESEGGGVVGKRKTKKTPPPPPTTTTKPRLLELIIAPPLAAQTTPPSGSESGSEGSHTHKKAHERRGPREQGEAKSATTKKRGACGKRSRSPAGGEADGNDRDDVAAAAEEKTAGASCGAASLRFPCSLCDRCFGSHQALGGHVLGHRKRTKIAAIAAAAAVLDADDADGAVEVTVSVTEEAAKSIAQADKKDSSVAARRGKDNGEGTSSDEGKTVDEAAARGDQDVGGARHKRQRKVHGKSSKGGVREPAFAGSHDDGANANDGFGNKCNTIGVSGHGCFTDGNNSRKMCIGTASLNRKVVVAAGTCHDGANGNSDGKVCSRTRYKCKVCGAECLTGRALGGHMRKHRKRPPVGGGGGGGGEERSPSPATDDDCQIPLARLFGAETSFLQRDV